MAKKGSPLYKRFQPVKYVLKLKSGTANLIINGKKLPPPSKRISLHQKNLKITKARIFQKTNRGSVEHEVVRINHLPSFEEVRLHTNQTLYPGNYEIILEYSLDKQRVAKLKSSAPNRELVPSIDEVAAWKSAALEIKQ